MASSFKVVIRDKAEHDLNNLFVYLFERTHEIAIAEKVARELYTDIMGLANKPNLNPKILDDAVEDKGYRKLICGEYVIPFLIDDVAKTITIVRVFHGKMNYAKYL